MGILQRNGFLARSMGGALAAMAAFHVVLVGWVAWYVAEAEWESAPLAASYTPLPPLTFVAAWVVGTAFLLLLGPFLGAALMSGPWMGADPTLVLPVGAAARAASAWMASETILGAVGMAAVPVYLGLHAMGAFGAAAIAWPVLTQVGAIAVAPLPGIGIVAARRRRSAVSW